MNTQEAIATRRSVRAYTPEHLTEAELAAILDAAYSSPIAGTLYKTMRLTVIQNKDALPKKDGLTRTMTDQIIRGAEVDGAGPCLGDRHRRAFDRDGFDDAQDKIREADAVAFVSPVYWEEVSEGLKSFMDRFHRCKSSGIFDQRQAALTGKSVLLVASAGGSGLDMIEPLKEMERFVHHTGGRVFDAVGINRWNQSYKGNAIYEAAKAMARGGKGRRDEGVR